MSVTSRRAFMKLAGLGVSAAILRSRRVLSAPAPRSGPTMLVHIFVGGGIDSILATDPKHRKQVVAEVDVPYADSDIKTAGGITYGPVLRGLEPYMSRMAILNGVSCSTVSHRTGRAQVQHMATTYNPSSAGLAATVGELHRRDAPVADVQFLANPSFDLTSPPGAGRSLVINPAFGIDDPSKPVDPTKGLLPTLSRLANDDLRRPAIRSALEAQLRACVGLECSSIEPTLALLDRMPRMPFDTRVAPQLVDPTDMLLSTTMAATLRDTLFVLENGLAPAVFMKFEGWDSHADNLLRQTQKWKTLSAGLEYFLAELQNRKAMDGGPLSERVGIVVCSELGRFPFLNNANGKDHFPELPVILIGPGLRVGQYGETDARMVATPISATTGRSASSPRDFVPTLNDVGTTILHWFGCADPRALGYRGRRLDFLLA